MKKEDQQIKEAARNYAYDITGNKSGHVQMSYPFYTKEINQAFSAGATFERQRIKKQYLDEVHVMD